MRTTHSFAEFAMRQVEIILHSKWIHCKTNLSAQIYWKSLDFQFFCY